MKKILVVLLGLFALQSAMAEEASKIVTVDFMRAVMGTEEGKLKIEKLKGEFERERAGLEALSLKGKNLQEKLQKDAAIMSSDEKHKMEKELMEIANELKFKQQQLQKSGQADERQYDAVRFGKCGAMIQCCSAAGAANSHRLLKRQSHAHGVVGG